MHKTRPQIPPRGTRDRREHTPGGYRMTAEPQPAIDQGLRQAHKQTRNRQHGLPATSDSAPGHGQRKHLVQQARSGGEGKRQTTRSGKVGTVASVYTIDKILPQRSPLRRSPPPAADHAAPPTPTPNTDSGETATPNHASTDRETYCQAKKKPLTMARMDSMEG